MTAAECAGRPATLDCRRQSSVPSYGPSLLDMFTRQPCSKIMRTGRTIKHRYRGNAPVIGGRLPVALSVGFLLQRHLSLSAPFATDLGPFFKCEETMTAKLLALL